MNITKKLTHDETMAKLINESMIIYRDEIDSLDLSFCDMNRLHSNINCCGHNGGCDCRHTETLFCHNCDLSGSGECDFDNRITFANMYLEKKRVQDRKSKK